MSDLIFTDVGAAVAAAPGALTISAQAVLDQTKRWLFTGGREERNKLNGSLGSTGASVTVEFALGAIQAGARISVELEDMHVWSAAGQVATVERGQYGSTATTHADDSLVFVNPKFSNNEIFTELCNEIDALSSPVSGLFQVTTVDLTFNPSYSAYDLTSVTNLDGILSVQYEDIGPSREYIPIDSWRLQRNLPTSDFASGFGLTLQQYVDPGRTVRVVYKQPFVRPSSLTDDLVSVSGLPATAGDVVAMGTALRLSTSREIRRNFNEDQGDTRRAAEVPANANLNAPSGLARKYEQRKNEEAARLRQRYPIRRK
jgi:hypothetical protein